MKWLSTPNRGSASVVSIFIAQTNTQKIWPGATYGSQLLGIIQTTQRIVWAVYAEKALNADERELIKKDRAKVERGASNAPRKPGIRAVLWGYKGNDRFFIELAYDNTENGSL